MRAVETLARSHTHTQDNYRNPRCACAPRINKTYSNVLTQKPEVKCGTSRLLFYLKTPSNQTTCNNSFSSFSTQWYCNSACQHFFHSWTNIAKAFSILYHLKKNANQLIIIVHLPARETCNHTTVRGRSFAHESCRHRCKTQ